MTTVTVIHILSLEKVNKYFTRLYHLILECG